MAHGSNDYVVVPVRCPAGYTPTNNQTSCVPCPRGTYQPKKDATDCMRCAGDKVDTRQPGATSDKQCEGETSCHQHTMFVNNL